MGLLGYIAIAPYAKPQRNRTMKDHLSTASSLRKYMLKPIIAYNIGRPYRLRRNGTKATTRYPSGESAGLTSVSIDSVMMRKKPRNLYGYLEITYTENIVSKVCTKLVGDQLAMFIKLSMTMVKEAMQMRSEMNCMNLWLLRQALRPPCTFVDFMLEL